MSIFRSRGARFTEAPADDEPTVPIRTVVVEQVESAVLARHEELKKLLRRVLLAESLKPDILRDEALTNLCLDARQILDPAPPLPDDDEAVPLRPSVPVVPGRAS